MQQPPELDQQRGEGGNAPIVDAAFVFVLVVLGLVGFRTTFGGTAFLAVGVFATALGIAISWLSQRQRHSVLVSIGLSIVAYFLLGGALADRSQTVGAVVPTVSTLRSLGDVAVVGWKDLLTTVPPVGNSGDLLVIPLILGILGGMAGYSLARRTANAFLPLIPPVAVLALSILFGTEQPASVFLQGVVFAAVALAWSALRADLAGTTKHSGGGRRNRMLAGAAVVVVSALGSLVVGPALPFATSQERVVLSRYVQPPFNVNADPGPLDSFRHYTKGAPGSDFDTPLFTVSGVPAGSLVTIATMDSYDGVVWGFGGAQSTDSSDTFRRFGSSIPVAYGGVQHTVTVHIDAMVGDWLPTIGQTTTLSFSGKDSSLLQSNLRYDTDTDSAADSFGLSPGDTYHFVTVVPREPSEAMRDGAAAGDEPLSVQIPTFVQADADKWIGKQSGAWQKVLALAAYLKTEGKYSNGTETVPLAAPGEDVGRLATFLNGTPLVGQQIVGDDEQYAATMAVMSNAVGVPPRVVFGAIVGGDGVVTGGDIHGWVQVELAGLGWMTIKSTQFTPTTSPNHITPRPQSVQFSQVAVAPPAVSAVQPPSNALLPSSKSPASGLHESESSHLPAIIGTLLTNVGIPLLILLAAAGIIVAIKGQRRRRRRLTGTPSERIAAAWLEILDQVIDLGLEIPRNATRREQAAVVPERAIGDLAFGADAAVFGPDNPTDEDARTYWDRVDTARRAMYKAAGGLRRLLAYLNITTLTAGLRRTTL